MELQAFRNYIKKMSDLNHAVMLLGWDLKTGAPKKAAESHIAALTTLSTEAFKMSISDELVGYLETIDAHKTECDEVTLGIAKKLKKDYDTVKNVPEKLYSRWVSLTAEGEHVWEGAKKDNDFKRFEPYLEELVTLSKEMAHCKNPNETTYNVLLDEFEPGMAEKEISKIFETLRKDIVPLVEAIGKKPAVDESRFKGHFDKVSQEKLAYLLLNTIGYDLEAGRLDESEHPFTTGTAPHDVRITTNYDLKDARSSLFSVLHEGGHGIYEQQINPMYKHTPLATGASMGIHESQSRFYENIIGKSKSFWTPLYGQVQSLIPQYSGMTIEQFYQGINAVTPSLIRIEADELTYNLHIILRFELEKALFEGDLQVKDLPAAWREKMKQYLGVVPETDSEGVLQDVHWAGGAFGYFPSYALGNVYGAQFMKQIEKEVGKVDELLLKGELNQITKWLSQNIHQYGISKTPQEIIRASCGGPIEVKPLIDYYKQKYTTLYGL